MDLPANPLFIDNFPSTIDPYSIRSLPNPDPETIKTDCTGPQLLAGIIDRFRCNATSQNGTTGPIDVQTREWSNLSKPDEEKLYSYRYTWTAGSYGGSKREPIACLENSEDQTDQEVAARIRALMNPKMLTES
ncbi:hypothetical protein V866_002393 [Kwoniella sp. B9012]